MIRRVLVLGDSLTLPRSKPEHCAFHETWPQLLKTEFDVHQVSLGGGTIRDIFRQVEYHVNFNPDCIILQSGIVDCAPRSLSQFELLFLDKFWVTRRFLLPLIKKKARLLRKIRKRQYTPPNIFRKYVRRIKQAFEGKLIIAVGIVPTCEAYEDAVPGITSKVQQYNLILRSELGSNFIDLSDFDRRGIMSDHIHLTPSGHSDLHARVVARMRGAHA